MFVKKAKLISDWRVWFIRKRLQLFILASLIGHFKSPRRVVKESNRIRKLRNAVHGKSNIKKFVYVNGHYYWASNFAGLPSDNLRQMISYEVHRNNGFNKRELIPQQTLFWAITNRCPLQCEHCFEWDNLDAKEHLSFGQLKQMLEAIEQHGIRHVQLSGGEPLARFNDLISLIKGAAKKIDFWLFTSGFGLTEKKAFSLHKAGLIGVNISLDHWNEKMHNAFRNHPKSFSWVLKAVENCRNAGLLICLSLCATKDFTSKKNLNNYLELARKMGVHFIQILEPRAVGNFSNKDVKLNNSQIELLSEFSVKINTHPDYKSFPIVAFYGYHQRKLGCMGAGNRYFYIDSMGEVHACPFCQRSAGNLLEHSLNDLIKKLREKKCHQFKMYQQ